MADVTSASPFASPDVQPPTPTRLRPLRTASWREACNEASLLSPLAAGFSRSLADGLSRRSMALPLLEDEKAGEAQEGSVDEWGCYQKELARCAVVDPSGWPGWATWGLRVIHLT